MKTRTLLICLLLFTILSFSACESRTGAHRSEKEIPESIDQDISMHQPDSSNSDESAAPEHPEDEYNAEEDATNALDAMLSALQTGNREEIQRHIDYKNFMQLQTDNQSDTSPLSILKRMKYEISELSVKDSMANATVVITNVDMTKMMPDYLRTAQELEFNNAISDSPLPPEEMEEKYAQMFLDLLDAASGSSITTTVEVKLLYSAEKWRVQSSKELRDAALGGYFTARSQMMGGE